MNQDLFLWINHWAQQWPDVLWSCWTILGHSSTVFALLAPALRHDRRILSAAILCAPLTGLGVYGLKNFFLHPRPAAVLDASRFHQIGDMVLLHNSFPSGHTATAFAIAGLLWVLVGRDVVGPDAWRRPGRWKRLAACWGILVLALGTAMSRMAVGAHWPQDVLAGMLVGSVSGVLAAVGALRLHRYAWTRGTPYRLVLALLLLLMSASLFVVDMGYSLARGFQYACGVWGLFWVGWSGWSEISSRVGQGA